MTWFELKMIKIHRFQPRCKHVQIIHNNNKLLYVFEMAIGVVTDLQF